MLGKFSYFCFRRGTTAHLRIYIVLNVVEKDICVYLHEGQYKRGEYTQSVLQNAGNNMLVNKH